MIKILAKNSEARLVSWLHPGLFPDIKNLKATHSSSKCVRGLGLHCKGRKKNTEKLWLEFFSDPSQWWDHRPDKGSARYPDFKHKKTEVGLWLVDNSNPPWVEAELAAMAPGALQLNISSWNKQLSRYVKDREYETAIKLFRQMQQEGMNPDKFTFIPILKACCNLQVLQDGKHIHLQIIETGCEADIMVATCLVDMYAKCGSMEDALRMFSKMSTRDVFSWTSMISGYVRCGEGQKALDMFQQMHIEGMKPDHVTFMAVLNACASLVALKEGRHVHEMIIQRGFELDVRVGSCLVDMYAKCGSIEDAWGVFNKMPTRNVVTWSAMIGGYAKCGAGHKALELFQQMHAEGITPNAFTFVGLLNACATIGSLKEGKCVHQNIIQSGCESDLFVANSLVDMYSKCGSVEDAWQVFNNMSTHDVVGWGAIIQGYVNSGQAQNALLLFEHMQLEGVEPDPTTFVAVLSACSSTGALEQGRRIHQLIVDSKCESDVWVSNCLVDMYAKCGSIEDAFEVFQKIPTCGVVAWSAIILGYVNCGKGQKALELSQQMELKGVQPNPVTLVGVLKACASVAALEEGRRVHQQIIQSGWESNIFLHSCLIDMYAKCGSLDESQKVFQMMGTCDVVSCNAMLGGYAMHGLTKEALQLSEQMSQEGVKLDGNTFLSLLSACTHGGLVNEGLHYFESMSSVYSISARVEHHGCLVDLLGRAGQLHEAEDLIKSMSLEPNSSVWTSLLAACRVHGNVEMGECVVKQVLGLEPRDAAGYVLMSNIYSAAAKSYNCA